MIPEKYKQIIDLPYHGSVSHPKMDRVDRAAQFSPFSALVGYDDIIDETNRFTEEQFDFGEEDKKILDEKLRLICEHEKERPTVSVTYFIPDEKKEGGAYLTLQGQVKELDAVSRTLVFTGGQKLPLDDLLQIESPLFARLAAERESDPS